MEQEQISYEEATAQIEAILNRFRNDEITIDELSKEVKRATELIKICRDKLVSAESELKKILE